MARLLIVEDQKKLVQSLRRGLEEEGYEILAATTGEEGYYLATTGSPDAIVLDVMLPGRDGLKVLRDLRGQGYAKPVLILTARDAVEDRVAGLDGGADDYLVKPFAFAELVARLNVLARRGAPRRDRVRIRHLEIDVPAHRVWAAGEPVELSPKQFALLAFLVAHAGEVVSRAMIVEQVFGYAFDAVTNIVDVHLSNLRQKIDRPGQPSLITTVRGVGFRIEAGEGPDA